MDLFVVPTIGFDLLYAFVIVRLDRRDLAWINVTTNPTAEWVARQITEAFPWDEAPRYVIRDRDRIYGAVVTRRLRAMGIRDKPIAPASPWQNGFAERLIGSSRRECLDHIIVLGEVHLRRILKSYAQYYNATGPRLALNKAAPISRSAEAAGRILCRPILGGLHHQYARVWFAVGTAHCVDCRRVVLRLRQGHRTRPFGLATALRSASRLGRGHPSLRHRKRLGQAEGISRGLPGCRCETSGVRGIDSASRPQHPCVLACPPCTCDGHHRRYATTDSQGARSRPHPPIPLWLWQEVLALPSSTAIVALTCS